MTIETLEGHRSISAILDDLRTVQEKLDLAKEQHKRTSFEWHRSHVDVEVDWPNGCYYADLQAELDYRQEVEDEFGEKWDTGKAKIAALEGRAQSLRNELIDAIAAAARTSDDTNDSRIITAPILERSVLLLYGRRKGGAAIGDAHERAVADTHNGEFSEAHALAIYKSELRSLILARRIWMGPVGLLIARLVWDVAGVLAELLG